MVVERRPCPTGTVGNAAATPAGGEGHRQGKQGAIPALEEGELERPLARHGGATPPPTVPAAMEVELELHRPEALLEGLTDEGAERGLERGQLRHFVEHSSAHTVQRSTASLSDAAAARVGMNSWANTPRKSVPAMNCAMPR